ncbi:MAG: protein TonB [Saprospiraceae bacterium]
MTHHIYSQVGLKYPQTAPSRGLEGKVYLEFIIEKDGSFSNVKIVRDIGLVCGQAAIEALKLMDAWKPGYQKGKPVRVLFILPVTSKLRFSNLQI